MIIYTHPSPLSDMKANTIQVLTNAFHLKNKLDHQFILIAREGRDKNWKLNISKHDESVNKIIDIIEIVTVPNLLVLFENIPFKIIKSILFRISSNIEGIIYSIKTYERIRKKYKKVKVIYSRSYHIIFLYKTLLRRWPNVEFAIEVHDLPKSRLGLKMFKYVINKCKAVFVVTKEIGKEIRKISEIKTYWLPDAVGKDAILKGEKSIIKKKEGEKKIGYMGRFTTYKKDKGVKEIINAFSDEQIRNKSKLVLIGATDQEYDHYFEIIKRQKLEDRVEIYKFMPRSKALEIINQCDILIMAQPKTKFYNKHISPLKLFEYMALGKLILNSQLLAIEEILPRNEFSLSFEPGDMQGMKKVMIEAIENYDCYFDMRKKVLAEVKKKYTWDQRSEEIIKKLGYT